MTISTVYSDNITNYLAGNIAERIQGNSLVQFDKKVVLTTSIDEIGDVILLGMVPSKARIVRVEILSDDLDSNGSPTLAMDVGLYYSGMGENQDGLDGTVIDADCIGSAITIGQAANTAGGNIRFESSNITTLGQMAWEVAGLAEDIGGVFYIGLTVTAAAATAVSGDISIMIHYI